MTNLQIFNISHITEWPGLHRRKPTPFMPTYLIRKPLATAVRDASALVINHNTVVVDIGCGQKPYFPFVGTHASYFGFDLTSNFPVDGLALGDRLPLPSECADVVFCFQVLEHVPNPATVVSEANRVLHPGGHLIVSVPCTYIYHPTPGDFWRWMPAGFQMFLEQLGFNVMKLWPNGGMFAAIAIPLLLQMAIVARRLERKSTLLFPIAKLIDGVIWSANLVIERIERLIPRYSQPFTPNSMLANLLILAKKR